SSPVDSSSSPVDSSSSPVDSSSSPVDSSSSPVDSSSSLVQSASKNSRTLRTAGVDPTHDAVALGITGLWIGIGRVADRELPRRRKRGARPGSGLLGGDAAADGVLIAHDVGLLGVVAHLRIARTVTLDTVLAEETLLPPLPGVPARRNGRTLVPGRGRGV